ncbi:protein rep [Sporosarcina sp. FSL K6-3457]|uniref:protein rep n=1 Tax=Sporosarcina sp. FSL K6-3457 TaxID=2978204 RepID=UPI004046AD37
MDRQTLESKLFKVWFCKSPLCPMCNWRKSMKHKPTCQWLFLTLSVKNVYDGEELDQSLRVMNLTKCKYVRFIRTAKPLIQKGLGCFC